jgi:hypothetical protein
VHALRFSGYAEFGSRRLFNAGPYHKMRVLQWLVGPATLRLTSCTGVAPSYRDVRLDGVDLKFARGQTDQDGRQGSQ